MNIVNLNSIGLSELDEHDKEQAKGGWWQAFLLGAAIEFGYGVYEGLNGK